MVRSVCISYLHKKSWCEGSNKLYSHIDFCVVVKGAFIPCVYKISKVKVCGYDGRQSKDLCDEVNEALAYDDFKSWELVFKFKIKQYKLQTSTMFFCVQCREGLNNVMVDKVPKFLQQ